MQNARLRFATRSPNRLPPASVTSFALPCCVCPCSEGKSLTDELSGRERVLEGLGRDLMRGLNSVKRITQEQQLEDKVCGRGMQLVRAEVPLAERAPGAAATARGTCSLLQRRCPPTQCDLQLTHAALLCPHRCMAR